MVARLPAVPLPLPTPATGEGAGGGLSRSSHSTVTGHWRGIWLRWDGPAALPFPDHERRTAAPRDDILCHQTWSRPVHRDANARNGTPSGPRTACAPAQRGGHHRGGFTDSAYSHRADDCARISECAGHGLLGHAARVRPPAARASGAAPGSARAPGDLPRRGAPSRGRRGRAPLRRAGIARVSHLWRPGAWLRPLPLPRLSARSWWRSPARGAGSARPAAAGAWRSGRRT